MQQNKKRKEIEDKVLEIYRKVSPSHRNLINNQSKNQFFNQRINLFNSLGIPLTFFKNKKILEIGGGTGEKALFYAFYGADVTIIDPNEKSCEISKNIFLKTNLRKKLSIINKSIFDVDLKIIENFDMISIEGVLHHTFNPMMTLNLILKNMVENQIILIAIGESHGMMKRELQKEAVTKLAKNDPAIIPSIVKKLFPEHLKRATNHDLRSVESIIQDNYVNPQDESTSLKKICDTFFKNKISYLSGYPKLDLFYITNPWNHERENYFNYDFYSGYYKFLEKIWMTCGEEKISGGLHNFDFQNIIKHATYQEKKLLKLKHKIKKKSFSEKDLEIIKKGYMGIGLNYFVGVKQNSDSKKFTKKLSKYKKM